MIVSLCPPFLTGNSLSLSLLERRGLKRIRKDGKRICRKRCARVRRLALLIPSAARSLRQGRDSEPAAKKSPECGYENATDHHRKLYVGEGGGPLKVCP